MQKGKGAKSKGPGTRDEAAWARTDVIERENMRNEKLEKYYKAQNILPDDEWTAFLETMRNPLPTTFRVAGSRQLVISHHYGTYIHQILQVCAAFE